MKFVFCVNRAEAIRGGHNQAGEVSIDIDPATLTQEDRETLARCTIGEKVMVKKSWGNSTVEAAAPTAEALLIAVRKAEQDAEAERAERKKLEDEELAEVEARHAEALRTRKTKGTPGHLEPDSGWGLNYARGREAELKTINSPEWAAWVEELKAENERHKEEQKAQAEAEAARKEAARKEAETRLREWAEAHGSELLRARIADGFQWVGLAHEEYATAAGATAAGDLESADEPDGYSSTSVEDRTHPTLAEIAALRAVRERIKTDGVTAELVRVTYSPDEDAEGYSSYLDPIARTEIRLTITTPGGREMDRYYLAPTE